MIKWETDKETFQYRINGYKKDKILYNISVSLIIDKVCLYQDGIKIKDECIIFKSVEKAIEDLKYYVKYLERSKKINNLVKILKENNG